MATARLIWIAMLAAVGAYLLVLAALIGSDAAPAPVADVATLRRALMLLTMALVAVPFWLRRRLPLRNYGPDRPRPSAQTVSVTYVLCWALSDSIASLGLVLGLLSHDIGEAYPFFVLAIALLVWQRPRAEHFAAAA
jgi:hypothetical protein